MTPVDRQPVNRLDEQAVTALRNEAQHVANGGTARPSVLIAAADTLAGRVRDLEAALREAPDCPPTDKEYLAWFTGPRLAALAPVVSE